MRSAWLEDEASCCVVLCCFDLEIRHTTTSSRIERANCERVHKAAGHLLPSLGVGAPRPPREKRPSSA
jgi:hypothetical protein